MILKYICMVLLYLPQCIFADILLYLYTELLPMQDFKDLPSQFGGEIPFEGLEGKIRYADPADGCQPIEPAPPNSTNRWVALISRNNCTFERKIRNAQSANYDAVIVHNIGSDYLEEMSVKNISGIEIPSLFIGEHDGQYLQNKFMTPDIYYIIITPDAPFNINTHLLLPFAIVVAICFMVMVIFMVVKCIKDRRRQRRQRLPTSALKQMLIHKFQKGDPYETCAICLDDYIENEKLRVLPCAHAYHSKCIDPWLTNNRRVCPVCKRRVLAADEDQGNLDSSDTDDETSPLVNPVDRNRTGGGTFAEADDRRMPSSVERVLRAQATVARLRSLIAHSRQFASSVAVENHSINGDTSRSVSPGRIVTLDDSSSSSTSSNTTTESDYHTQPSSGNDDVHVIVVTPEMANRSDENVL